jgi:hypothetical protein
MGVGIGGNPYGYSPWYQPNPSYGSGYTDTGLAPVGKSILEQAPDTGWYRYGRQLGVGDDNSAFSQWFKKQYPSFQQGYQSYTTDNPLTANITDYTNSLGGIDQWLRQFHMMDPRLRGLSPGERGGGPARWLMR